MASYRSYFFSLLLILPTLFTSPLLHSLPSKLLTVEEEQYIKNLAQDTYHCIDFFVSQRTGLPMDSSQVDKDAHTSVTNIGFYIASVVSACELGFEKREKAVLKLRNLLGSLQKLSTWNNFPYCWNHCENLGKHKEDFISTVDLGNYYAGIIIARQYFPELKNICDQLLNINWNKLYDSKRKLLYGGYDTKKGGYGQWHYDSLGADSRLTSFLAIAMSNVPIESWNSLNRTLEERHGVEYLKPGWLGGGLFLGFMSGLFMDEYGTLPNLSAGNFAKAQMIHAEKMGYPVWGWSASDSPSYGYLGYQAIRDEVVTPHASALAISLFPKEVVENLKKLDELGVRPRHLISGQYHNFGFRDAYDIMTQKVTQNYLMLDQMMLFLSFANFLEDGVVIRLFNSYPPIKTALPRIKDYSSRLSQKDVNFPISLSELFSLKKIPYDSKRPEYKALFMQEPLNSNSQKWQKAEVITLSSPQLEMGKIQNEEDLLVKASLLWDHNFLYVKSNVVDQSLQAEFTGPDIYKGDLVEIYINPDAQGLLWGNAKDFQIGITPPSHNGVYHTYAWFQNRQPNNSELRTTSERTDHGYQVTTAISWKFLGVTHPAQGQTLGFSAAVNDIDDKRIENTKLNWYFKHKTGKIELGKLTLQ